MTLKKCRFCGTEVKLTEDTCPNCGKDIFRDKKLTNTGIVAVIMFIGILILYANHC